MGRKINPLGFRLGNLYTWKSRWYADDKNYSNLVLEDVRLRRYLMDKLRSAGIVKIEIERSINKITLIIWVARPGVVIGRGGSGLESLKKEIEKKIFGKGERKVKIDLQIREVKDADASAQIALSKLEDMLLKRFPQRRAVAMTIERVMSSGAKGVKIVLSGRIGGAEISRTEKYGMGSMPAQTLRADIDYAQKPALTKSGYVGIKVWVYKGEKEIK